jgi:hypothetical protein
MGVKARQAIRIEKQSDPLLHFSVRSSVLLQEGKPNAQQYL